MAKRKFYVVWVGLSPGVYDSWDECKLQVVNYPGAKYKGYDTQEEAVEAYRGDPQEHLNFMRAVVRHEMGAPKRDYRDIPAVRLDAIAVDGACAGNPGKMEYRAVRLMDGAEVFRVGADGRFIGTNNIAEYVGMIHLAAMLAKAGDFHTPIYTDSRNTFSWLRRGRSKTSLESTPATAPALALLARADAWLAANGPIRNPILKWNTEEWGEIPADFGRKH